MNLRKRVNGSWTDIPYYLHNTSTDTITTLPVDIYANAATATVGLKGNMSQTGTPTPQNPIQPSECGEKTANLLVFDTDYYIGGVNFNVTPVKGTAQFVINKVQTTSAQSCTIPLSIPLKQGTYTLSVSGIIDRDGSYDRIYIRDADGVIVNYVQEGVPKTFTLANDTTITALSIPCGATSTYDNVTVNIMLNTGSTALPYEPYGVKIPISSANTTTPVYLGEVQSARQIKKLVLTGEEEYLQYSGSTGVGLRLTVEDMRIPSSVAQRVEGYCTHFVPTTAPSSAIVDSITFGTSGNMIYIILSVASQHALNVSTYDEFKAWISAQYAAGTPVTVWYVLATEKTAVVNEPLMKIGDYADEVANISIPVTAGGDTISVGTTVQPSEVTVNYKGWHPKTPKESNNGQWS